MAKDKVIIVFYIVRWANSKGKYQIDNGCNRVVSKRPLYTKQTIFEKRSMVKNMLATIINYYYYIFNGAKENNSKLC